MVLILFKEEEEEEEEESGISQQTQAHAVFRHSFVLTLVCFFFSLLFFSVFI